MTPTLVRQHSPSTRAPAPVDPRARARDWSEIQERMLVPLHEAVYERLDVGVGAHVLGLGCGSGLALLIASARGAAVTGVEARFPERLAHARQRLRPQGPGTAPLKDARADEELTPGTPAYTVVTAFEPTGCLAGDAEGLDDALAEAVPLARRGAAVVLAGWGPPERCATASVLRVAAKPADPLRGPAGWRPALRDDLEEVAQRAGLRPDGSGRVACPFGYADTASAARGLLSTGLLDAAVAAAGQEQVAKELAEALHPYRRRDGTVWMPNVFRYLIARVP
ncbi:SAM-dependent methyltransferase [Streptomyces sp. NPDC048182]|uniref:SAM-dependent methyltransferase n=1 Tax=Streptomyces sp. NPDC048182 TaxID=3365507 RepID=UPI003710A815